MRHGEKGYRKLTGVGLCAFFLALGFSVEAQQPKNVPRIGYLSGTDPATDAPRSEGIRLAAMWMSSH